MKGAPEDEDGPDGVETRWMMPRRASVVPGGQNKLSAAGLLGGKDACSREKVSGGGERGLYGSSGGGCMHSRVQLVFGNSSLFRTAL